jgi:hypothetical protein
MKPLRTALRFAGVFVVCCLVAACAVAAGGSPAHAAEVGRAMFQPSHHPFSLVGVSLMGLTGEPVNYSKVATLNLGYKRSTTKLYRTYTRRVLEYRMFDDIPDEEIVPSGRLNNILLDVAAGVGAHQADDAGYEGRTETPELEEGEFVFNHTNSRFSISLRAQAFDKAARGNQIIRQIKYQSLKCIEAVMRKYGLMTYGLSTGVVAIVDGNPASGTTAVISLRDAFGQSGMTDPGYLAQMFPIDEGVGFVRANALIGAADVTASDDVAGTITVEFRGDTVDLADGDQIVFANGVIGGTLAETDWQKWNVGILDALISDEVHGVSKSDVPSWAPALFDSDGGSWGFIKGRRVRQALENKGDTVLRRVLLSNGVQNDKDARERQALVWMNNSTSMNIDGNATMKGVEEITTRFVPPTCAFGIGADAMGKKVLTDKPDEEETIDFGKLFKAEDRSALKGGVDMISAMIFRSRSRITGHINLDEQ